MSLQGGEELLFPSVLVPLGSTTAREEDREDQKLRGLRNDVLCRAGSGGSAAFLFHEMQGCCQSLEGEGLRRLREDVQASSRAHYAAVLFTDLRIHLSEERRGEVVRGLWVAVLCRPWPRKGETLFSSVYGGVAETEESACQVQDLFGGETAFFLVGEGYDLLFDPLSEQRP